MSRLNIGNLARIASVMAQLSAKNAIQANLQQRMVADQNIAAGMARLDLDESMARVRMARELASHEGTLAANFAFRGTSGIAEQAATTAARMQASSELAFSRASRAADESALIASQQFIPRDPAMAAIEGALQGLTIGAELESLLLAATTTGQRTTNIFERHGHDLFTTGIQTTDFARTPGFDPSTFFQDLFS